MFLPTYVLLPFPACFSTKQSTVSRLLYLFHDKESGKFPMHKLSADDATPLAVCFILHKVMHLQPSRVRVLSGLCYKSVRLTGEHATYGFDQISPSATSTGDLGTKLRC